MALSPGISRLASGATYGGFPMAGPVADVTPAQTTELNPRETLARESFRYSDFAPDQKRTRPDQTLADSDRVRRRIVGSLLSTSTESFSVAFEPHPQFNVLPNSPGASNTKAAVQRGIETYELTSAVIHDTLAPRGENLSLTL